MMAGVAGVLARDSWARARLWAADSARRPALSPSQLHHATLSSPSYHPAGTAGAGTAWQACSATLRPSLAPSPSRCRASGPYWLALPITCF